MLHGRSLKSHMTCSTSRNPPWALLVLLSCLLIISAVILVSSQLLLDKSRYLESVRISARQLGAADVLNASIASALRLRISDLESENAQLRRQSASLTPPLSHLQPATDTDAKEQLLLSPTQLITYAARALLFPSRDAANPVRRAWAMHGLDWHNLVRPVTGVPKPRGGADGAGASAEAALYRDRREVTKARLLDLILGYARVSPSGAELAARAADALAEVPLEGSPGTARPQSLRGGRHHGPPAGLAGAQLRGLPGSAPTPKRHRDRRCSGRCPGGAWGGGHSSAQRTAAVSSSSSSSSSSGLGAAQLSLRAAVGSARRGSPRALRSSRLWRGADVPRRRRPELTHLQTSGAPRLIRGPSPSTPPAPSSPTRASCTAARASASMMSCADGARSPRAQRPSSQRRWGGGGGTAGGGGGLCVGRWLPHWGEPEGAAPLPACMGPLHVTAASVPEWWGQQGQAAQWSGAAPPPMHPRCGQGRARSPRSPRPRPAGCSSRAPCPPSSLWTGRADGLPLLHGASEEGGGQDGLPLLHGASEEEGGQDGLPLLSRVRQRRGGGGARWPATSPFPLTHSWVTLRVRALAGDGCGLGLRGRARGGLPHLRVHAWVRPTVPGRVPRLAPALQMRLPQAPWRGRAVGGGQRGGTGSSVQPRPSL